MLFRGLGLQIYAKFLFQQIFSAIFFISLLTACRQGKHRHSQFPEQQLAMDIDLLSKMVRELILDSDEVTLPGLGTFVTEIVPSTFSDKGYTINPPYRRLYFRERENGSDDSLVRFYASSNHIPAEKARPIIMDFLTEMKVVLKEKKTIIFPGLGRLRATKENNFFFVADEDLDIWPAGFALEPVSLKTHVETKEEVGAAVSSLRSILDSPESEPVAGAKPAPEQAVATETQEVEDVPAVEESALEQPVPEQPEEEMPIEEQLAPEQPAEEAAPVPDEEEKEPEEATVAEQKVPEPAVAAAEAGVPEPAAEEPEGKAPEAAIPEPEAKEEPAPATSEPTEEEPKAAQEQAAEEQAAEALEGKTAESHGRRWWKILLWVLAALAAILAAYMIAGRMGLLDSILYSPEDLEYLKDYNL